MSLIHFFFLIARNWTSQVFWLIIFELRSSVCLFFAPVTAQSAVRTQICLVSPHFLTQGG